RAGKAQHERSMNVLFGTARDLVFSATSEEKISLQSLSESLGNNPGGKMATVTGTIAERLGEHITRLDYASLPSNVIDKTKEALLDQLGCQLVGSTLGHCNIIYDFIKDFAGQPEATVVNRDFKTWAHDAAFVNATFGHACEIDDHIDTGGGHPGAYSTAVSL